MSQALFPGHSAVAELRRHPPGGDLGDGALDVGPTGHVVLRAVPGPAVQSARAAQQAVVLVLVQVRGTGAALAVVHRARSGQPRQATPKMTALRAVICRVIPAGQVTVPAAVSTIEVISQMKPPWTAGLITARCPASVIAARRSPVP